jgi:hypothetical protein
MVTGCDQQPTLALFDGGIKATSLTSTVTDAAHWLLLLISRSLPISSGCLYASLDATALLNIRKHDPVRDRIRKL